MGLRQEGGKTLITPASGGGGNVTIDGPLGSQPAAQSVSVALASDQLPLPVSATIDPSGLATEATLQAILDQIDVDLSTRASEATLAALLAQIDVPLSTRASEATSLNILGQLDLPLSTLNTNIADIIAQLMFIQSILETSGIRISNWFGSTAPTVGQKTMVNSIPVVLPSNQSAIPITAAALPLPSGAATEATLQDVENELIDANLNLDEIEAAVETLAAGQYSEGDIDSAIQGNMPLALVNDVIETYTQGEKRPLSMTTQGRLRVSSVPAVTYMEFFRDKALGVIPDMTEITTTMPRLNQVPLDI